MTRVAAIHQPNFFPWLGYFDKIARCDVFVVLDDVQHQRTGSNWSNRVRLLVSGEARWITVPVRRPAHGTVRLDALEIAPEPWREKLLRALPLNYAAAPYRAEAMSLLDPLIRNPEHRLAAFNLKAIQVIATALGLERKFVLSSQFGLAETSNERLIELVRRTGCDTYLAGGGAQDYQQDEMFGLAGVTLQYQRFDHPVYPQSAETFTAGLSIIDVLMNCGVEGTRRLLEIR